MIRVVDTAAELFSRIEAHKPGWLNDANARTDTLAAGRGDPKSAERLESSQASLH